MEQAVNFYELKTQLADLGYHEPEVADQLRSIISQDEFHSAIVHTRKDGVKFEFELERNDQNGFEILFNYAWLDTGKGIVSRIFESDIPVDRAIELLYQKVFDEPDLDGPLDDDHIYELNYKQQNQYTMNTENLSYLQKQLLNLGFGEGMNKDLEKQIKSKAPEFTLDSTQTYNTDRADYQLYFKRGNESDMYFFNKYEAKTDGFDHTQTFYINKGSGMTAKEAYNLIEGRAVYKELENKEGDRYKAWVTLDTKGEKNEQGNYKMQTFSEGWNYRPERAIDKMDIVGINEPGAREKLMKSLEKGNRHQVTAMKDGKEVKLWLEANPADHRVNLTNYKGEAQQLEHYKKPEAKQQQKTAQGQEAAQEKKPRKSAKMKV
ncbi:hypothetical protein BEL04_08770 [Mucilaginibacter sp. PPCGB 2223]|uniref:hypothetical protein n=1 Tax=Mucilaginibacter sp. PPCGB 2223 TaxID=1886027 RepID=UPI0008244753|nr:hypothetical protein [Mucilaginibacter sp. PPCGB 2223]OCX54340.1 hypothetical protein BEL04_08770 [Mucilaginibacter sp. PPCGB 2223]